MSESTITRIAVQRGYSAAALMAAFEAHQRKQRLSQPIGTFDTAGVFHLKEHCACCVGLRRSTAQHPYSEILHGRSLTHVAHLHDVPMLHVRRLVKAFELARKYPLPNQHAQGQLTVLLNNILRPVSPRDVKCIDTGYAQVSNSASPGAR